MIFGAKYVYVCVHPIKYTEETGEDLNVSNPWKIKEQFAYYLYQSSVLQSAFKNSMSECIKQDISILITKIDWDFYLFPKVSQRTGY